MKKTKTQLKAERRARRHYGMAKLKKGQKPLWISKQDKNGWSLGLVLSDHTRWIRNVRFANKEDLAKALGGSAKIVLVEAK